MKGKDVCCGDVDADVDVDAEIDVGCSNGICGGDADADDDDDMDVNVDRFCFRFSSCGESEDGNDNVDDTGDVSGVDPFEFDPLLLALVDPFDGTGDTGDINMDIAGIDVDMDMDIAVVYSA